MEENALLSHKSMDLFRGEVKDFLFRRFPAGNWPSCTQLTGFHRDPADQIIAATSRILSLPLVTADTRQREYYGVEAIW
jgi:predicted nucleic acid-binding protein